MTNKERSVKFFEVVWNQRNEDALTGFVHPDVTATLEGGVLCYGLEEFRAWYKETLAAMPDLQIEVVDAIEEGPKVAVMWNATATIAGQTERAHGISWMLHRGDKIVEISDSWNKSAVEAKLATAV